MGMSLSIPHVAAGTLTAFPPLFGERRRLELPPLEVVELRAEDGTALRLHHAPGGPRGAVILAAGTGMTGLSMCLDTTRRSLAERLHQEGFDVWLLDWRSSPYLPAHAAPYTLDDVARYDWPAAVRAVRERTGLPRVSALGHCLSAPCLIFSLLRGYLRPEELDAIVLSQVGFHFTLSPLGWLRSHTHLDRVFPAEQMIHLRPEEATLHLPDAAIGALAAVVPHPCTSPVCHRQEAAFGVLLEHAQVDEETHALMGALIPVVNAGFLRDVVPLTRQPSALGAEDERHLARLALPITLLSGEHNQTFLPAGTEASFKRLCAANGPALYRRHVLAGYGHLDCLIGERADEDVFPHIVEALGPEVRARREPGRAGGADGL
jgi:hypothetical protein